MPYHKVLDHPACSSGQTAVIKNDDGRVMGCHDTEEAANAQIAALHAAERRRGR